MSIALNTFKYVFRIFGDFNESMKILPGCLCYCISICSLIYSPVRIQFFAMQSVDNDMRITAKLVKNRIVNISYQFFRKSILNVYTT